MYFPGLFIQRALAQGEQRLWVDNFGLNRWSQFWRSSIASLTFCYFFQEITLLLFCPQKHERVNCILTHESDSFMASLKQNTFIIIRQSVYSVLLNFEIPIDMKILRFMIVSISQHWIRNIITYTTIWQTNNVQSIGVKGK